MTDGLIDFEYKKYILLAYLQHVEKNFDHSKLYPELSDLIAHYENATILKNNKQALQSDFPKEINRIDLNKLRLLYKEVSESDSFFHDIEQLVEYAIPAIKRTMDLGKELYEEVENQLTVDTVGIVPLYKDEGYVFIENGKDRITQIFRYTLKKFLMYNEQFRGIYFQWVDSVKRGIGHTLENLKVDLTRRFTELPNPATFFIHSKCVYPKQETLIPVSKRLVMRTVQELN